MSGVPATPAEVVAKYNEVVNAAKKTPQYAAMHKVGTVDIQCTDCSVSMLQGTVDKLLQSFMKGTDKTFTVTNGVATDQDGNQADMNAYIVPNGRDAALKEEYVASATATASGDGYTLDIKLKSETSTFDGTNTVKPVGHESCLDPLNLATLELPAGAKITEASMTYPGATLIVTVNGAGQMTKLDINLPLEGTGTGKLGAQLTLGLKGGMTETYDFTYELTSPLFTPRRRFLPGFFLCLFMRLSLVCATAFFIAGESLVGFPYAQSHPTKERSPYTGKTAKSNKKQPARNGLFFSKFIPGLLYLCTRPEPSPPASFSTSPTPTRLKSPSIECLSAEAATANSIACWVSLPFLRA